jgi:hypothetical protein
MTDCMHMLLHSTGSHTSISTIKHTTTATTAMTPNNAEPGLSLEDVEKNDEGSTSHVSNREGPCQVPLTLPLAYDPANNEAVGALEGDDLILPARDGHLASFGDIEMELGTTIPLESLHDIVFKEPFFKNDRSLRSASLPSPDFFMSR